jgi:cytochrome c biogenesis protein CcdA
MLRLLAIVISIGFADSLNPSTIAPALVLASGENSRERVSHFTLGVFCVYLFGGVVIALGPGQLVLSLVPHPDREARHILEVIAGAVMLAAGWILWHHRSTLPDRIQPPEGTEQRSSAWLGAAITAVELPTAFPYFAAIAAIVGSGLDPLRQLFLLVLFNLIFVGPLVGIVGTLYLAGDRAAEVLSGIRAFMIRRWPVILAVVALLVGTFVILLGATGIVGRAHGKLGRLARHVSHVLSSP